ncbi:9495_t:CDS:2, partial [Dentiscutata erythropus]
GGKAVFTNSTPRQRIRSKNENALILDIQKLENFSTNDIIAALAIKLGDDLVGAKVHMSRELRQHLRKTNELREKARAANTQFTELNFSADNPYTKVDTTATKPNEYVNTKNTEPEQKAKMVESEPEVMVTDLPEKLNPHTALTGTNHTETTPTDMPSAIESSNRTEAMSTETSVATVNADHREAMSINIPPETDPIEIQEEPFTT